PSTTSLRFRKAGSFHCQRSIRSSSCWYTCIEPAQSYIENTTELLLYRQRCPLTKPLLQSLISRFAAALFYFCSSLWLRRARRSHNGEHSGSTRAITAGYKPHLERDRVDPKNENR